MNRKRGEGRGKDGGMAGERKEEDFQKSHTGIVSVLHRYCRITQATPRDSSGTVAEYLKYHLRAVRLRGSVVERRSLAGLLSLSRARPVADG